MAKLPRLTVQRVAPVQGARPPELGQPVHASFSASTLDCPERIRRVHERCMTHAMTAFKHPQHLWGAASVDKDEARAARLEMPEMLDKVCLVARELGLSYAACSAGPSIGSPCLVWLLHDAPFLEGSGNAAHTPRRKFGARPPTAAPHALARSKCSLCRRPRVALGCNSRRFAVHCRRIFKHIEAALGTVNWSWTRGPPRAF